MNYNIVSGLSWKLSPEALSRWGSIQAARSFPKGFTSNISKNPWEKQVPNHPLRILATRTNSEQYCSLILKLLWKGFVKRLWMRYAPTHFLIITTYRQARSQDLEKGGAILKEWEVCKRPWLEFSLILNQFQTVCPKLEAKCLGKLGNSKVFSAQN